jgi:hypothetical protein
VAGRIKDIKKEMNKEHIVIDDDVYNDAQK